MNAGVVGETMWVVIGSDILRVAMLFLSRHRLLLGLPEALGALRVYRQQLLGRPEESVESQQQLRT